MRIPNRALTNFELLKFAKILKLRCFRGVFCRDELTRMKPRNKEMGILNLDSSEGEGTHWCAWSSLNRKNWDEKTVLYYDSFGLRPPKEFMKYFAGYGVYYSNDMDQSITSENCGKLCLQFLRKENARHIRSCGTAAT